MAVEIYTTNVTPSQFLSYIRATFKRKGIDYADIPTLEEFATLDDEGLGRFGSDEFWFTKPYAYQTYTKSQFGIFNEICEFTFDDKKTGHGYYYLVNEKY